MTGVVVVLLLALLIALMAVLFAVQNPTMVPITFMVWQTEGSVAVILLVAFGLGVLTMFLLMVPGIIKRGFRLSKQDKKIKQLAKTLPQEDSKPEKVDEKAGKK